MKDLNNKELAYVSGGFGPLGAVLGGVTGGVSAAASGGDSRAILHGVIFGALSGLTGGLAAATSGFVRLGWGIRSVATGAIGGIDPDSSKK